MIIKKTIVVTALLLAFVGYLYFGGLPSESPNKLPIVATSEDFSTSERKTDSPHNESKAKTTSKFDEAQNQVANKKELEANIETESLDSESEETESFENESLETESRQDWDPYITKGSEKYEELLSKSMSSDAPVIVGDSIYFRLVIDGEVVFSEINEKEADVVLNEPFSMYNELVDKLNDLESHGDWSFDTEELVRDIFRDNFEDSSYSINAMQCRERTCIVELTYNIAGAAESFTETLRYNKVLCECNVGEYIWPEEKRAVFKVILI